MPAYSTIPAQELGHIDPNQGIIIDVRTHMEHAEKHVDFGHALVPLDELNPRDFMMRHGLDEDSSVYILCRSGKRAAQAAEQFTAAGYRHVYVIEGGIIACEECGHKIKGYGAGDVSADKSRGLISLERQVRITAGLFAAVGAALALGVNSMFAVIPLFVGGGLVFAGVTDRCGMALILTKAPWNRKQSASCCASTTTNAGESCR